MACTVTTLQGRSTAREPGRTMWMESGVDPEERQGKPGGVVYGQTATLHARVPACREGKSLPKKGSAEIVSEGRVQVPHLLSLVSRRPGQS